MQLEINGKSIELEGEFPILEKFIVDNSIDKIKVRARETIYPDGSLSLECVIPVLKQTKVDPKLNKHNIRESKINGD